MTRAVRHLAAAILGAVFLMPATASADTEGCASLPEYNALTVLMSTTGVRNLFDVPGWYGPDNASRFTIQFRTCWAPGVQTVRVFFDWDDGLSRRWVIVDV